MDRRQMRKVCANCKQTYQSEDKYCRYCGAPKGKPDYIEESFEIIYGPMPVKRIHICEKCGYTWETDLMIDEEKWCPQCGGLASLVFDEEWEEWI